MKHLCQFLEFYNAIQRFELIKSQHDLTAIARRYNSMKSQIPMLGCNTSTISLLLLTCSFLIGLTALSIDLIVLGVSPLAEGPPNFDSVYLLRTALIVLTSGLLVYAVVLLQPAKLSTFSQESESALWGNWGRLITWLILLCALVFLIIFLSSPKLFNTLGSEDNPVEYLSAAICFVNFGIFLYITHLIYQHFEQHRIFYLLIALAFAAAFFLIGMEEISWFQRVLAIETPDIFKGNIQNEMNLHNFATNKVENAYYLSAFIVLILLPFTWDKVPYLKQNKLLSFFIPSRFVLFSSAIFVAYNFDMWNNLFTQFSVFVTLFILLHYARLYIHIGLNATTAVSVIVVFTLTQVLFIMFGSNFVRAWDVTEYKELLIPISYLLYSIEILSRARQQITYTAK